ncbi:MAG: MMPL family transporter, partial [Candidatus Geothermincolales bacterium]
MKKAFGWMASGSVHRPYIAIALVLLMTVVLGAGIFRLRMEFTQRTMLPEDYPSVRAMEKVERDFGGAEYAKVLVEGGDLASAEGALALYRFERDLREGRDNSFYRDFIIRAESYVTNLARNPQADLLFRLCLAFKEGSREEAAELIRGALSDPAVAQYRGNPQAAPLYSSVERLVSGDLDDASWEALKGQAVFLLERGVEEAVRQYLSSPGGELVLGRTISPDHRYGLINLQINPDLDQKEKYERAGDFRRYAEDFFDSHGLKASVSGEVYIMRVFQDRAMRDSALLGLIAFLFIVFVLFLTFRRVLDVALTLLVVAISNLWVFGLMGYAGIRYTMMSVAIVPLLLGIDIAYSIHILTRYYEERDKKRGATDSAVASVSTVGIAVFLAAATTMFGFLSFSISDMPPMRDFGWMCLAGVFFGFLLSVTLLPAALVIRDRRSEEVGATRKESNRLIDWLDRGLARLSLLAERHRALTWTATVLLIVVFGFLMTGLSTSADFRTFVPQDLP